MKKQLVTIILLVISLSFVGFSQTTKETKEEKKARKQQKKLLKKQQREEKKREAEKPKLMVVELQEPPKVIQTEVAFEIPGIPANGSLYTDNAVNSSLLGDFKARRVGDLVFVDVVENDTATVNSEAKRERDSGTLGGIGTLISALPLAGAEAAGNVTRDLGTRTFEGKGSTQRNSNVKARITARVVKVFPNGDLMIQALKLVKINKETEQLALTGIVRRNDLAGDNSIESISIGDLRIEFNGKGIASADNAPGWLFRLFDKISPF